MPLWSWKRHSFNPSIHKYEKKDPIKTLAIIYLITGLVVTGGAIFVIQRQKGIKENSQHDLRSNVADAISTDLCIKTKAGFYDCTDKITAEKAKLNPLHYVYQEQIKATVTAYNSVPSQTSSHPCIGADGTDICEARERGIQSCATKLAGFGSIIHVRGWSDCIVHDRLSARFIDRVDLYFGGADRVADAKRWGKRREVITIEYPITKPRYERN